MYSVSESKVPNSDQWQRFVFFFLIKKKTYRLYGLTPTDRGGDGLWYEFINAQLMALENRVLV